MEINYDQTKTGELLSLAGNRDDFTTPSLTLTEVILKLDKPFCQHAN